jgi:hypothetical protein
MLITFVISTIILIFAILILGFRVFFIKGGEFPNIHIGGNKSLKSQGIHCATTQDRNAQKKQAGMTNADLIREITTNNN